MACYVQVNAHLIAKVRRCNPPYEGVAKGVDKPVSGARLSLSVHPRRG